MIVRDQTANLMLAYMPLDQVARDDAKGFADFRRIVRQSITDTEDTACKDVWRAIWAELPDASAARLDAALDGECDLWLADLVILKFIRANGRPALVRGDIGHVVKRVESLAGKAASIAREVSVLNAALRDNTADGINISAAEADLAAGEIVLALADLQSALAVLASKRDGNIGLGRRTNAARRRFAREWVALWQAVGLAVDGDDGEMLENALAGAIEAIEGKVGKGEREWVVPLIAAAQLPDDADDETSK